MFKLERVGGEGGVVGGVVLVLADPERMNKKLISLSPPPVMSQTVPSQRDCGRAVECALLSPQ